jgi:cell division protein FtsL
LLAVVASALYLVHTQYESRRFSRRSTRRKPRRALETENERLQVEKRAQATPLRVEKLAREKLQMRWPRRPSRLCDVFGAARQSSGRACMPAGQKVNR